MKKEHNKRVDIVKIQLVKESSMLYKGRRMNSPDMAVDLLREYLGEVDREHFVVLCLNTKNEPVNITTAHIGAIDASIVHQREVLKTAILSNSRSILICHNHPSGDPTPSEEDAKVTIKVQEACNIMGIELLDHIILGDEKYISMKTEGYF